MAVFALASDFEPGRDRSCARPNESEKGAWNQKRKKGSKAKLANMKHERRKEGRAEGREGGTERERKRECAICPERE